MISVPFVSGAIMMSSLVVSGFFIRFWKRTGDRFFAIFSVAFLMLAIERVVLEILSPSHEIRPFVYLIRLTAFILIFIAILNKNRRSPH